MSAKKISLTKNIQRAVSFIGMLNIGAIFTFFLNSPLHQVLEHSARFFLFPFQAAIDITKAILLWRRAYLEKPENRGRHIRNAIVETVVAIGIAVTVVGGFLSLAIHGVASIVFAALLGAKSLYHLGYAMFYAHKAQTAKDAKEKSEFKKLAVENLLSGIVLALTTTAIVGAMVFGLSPFAMVGIGAAAAGVGAILSFAVKHYMKRLERRTMAKAAEKEIEMGPMNNTGLHRDLGVTERAKIGTEMKTEQRFQPGVLPSHVANADAIVEAVLPRERGIVIGMR